MPKLFVSAHAIRDCANRNCCTCGGRHNTMLYQHYISCQNQSAMYEIKLAQNQPLQSKRQCPNANQFNPRGLGIHMDSSLTQPSGNTNQDSTSYQARSNLATISNAVLLVTAVIHMVKFYIARALIDSGSEGTFSSERLFKAFKFQHKLLRYRFQD